ncbi:uncharacterized protein B0H18DRAFT_830608, partial [Fomitopsis serialis]
PIEICERVIDIVYLDITHALEYRLKTLRACMRVCRAWVPRCRYYLLHGVTLEDRKQLWKFSALL